MAVPQPQKLMNRYKLIETYRQQPPQAMLAWVNPDTKKRVQILHMSPHNRPNYKSIILDIKKELEDQETVTLAKVVQKRADQLEAARAQEAGEAEGE